jgi:hypothetical protein
MDIKCNKPFEEVLASLVKFLDQSYDATRMGIFRVFRSSALYRAPEGTHNLYAEITDYLNRHLSDNKEVHDLYLKHLEEIK